MFSYIIRRVLYMIPIVFGVMLITFILFYVVQTPEQMARRIHGPKASPKLIENWLHNRGYDKPVYFNTQPGKNLFDSQFFHSIKSLALFDLGVSDETGDPVLAMFKRGAIPSLLITLPAFVLGFLLAVAFSLFLVFVRESALDLWGIVICVALMSIPVMVYVIFIQALMANAFKYFPAFGFSIEGISTVKFLALPVISMILSGFGADVRIYRAIFLEEIRGEYVRTAFAKGASSSRVLFKHVLKNGMISLVTLLVASIPTLILGSVVTESFFGIPGLGNFAKQAITTSDFALIRADVYLGALLILFGLLLTDICYALVDPRVKLD